MNHNSNHATQSLLLYGHHQEAMSCLFPQAMSQCITQPFEFYLNNLNFLENGIEHRDFYQIDSNKFSQMKHLILAINQQQFEMIKNSLRELKQRFPNLMVSLWCTPFMKNADLFLAQHDELSHLILHDFRKTTESLLASIVEGINLNTVKNLCFSEKSCIVCNKTSLKLTDVIRESIHQFKTQQLLLIRE